VVAIITGDIVSSTKLQPKERQQLYNNTDSFLKSLPAYINSYETFRGDSLQCQAIDPAMSLRVALLIRSFFRAYTTTDKKKTLLKKSKGYFTTNYDIRLAIGMGETDFIDKKITSSDGEAFRLSGHALDSLKDSTQRLVIQTANSQFNEQWEPPILLLDALVQRWTQTQAELVLYKLQKVREDEIAARLQITQSAVTQRKKTAQWYAVEKLLEYFEKTIYNNKQ
jgi:DNA-directed RNA polymerase specialized sigma subunit